MDLFNLHRLFLSIVSGRIQPPGHPPNFSKNLVLVNCKSTVLALFLIVFAACTPNPDLSENPVNLPDQDMTGTEGQEESAPEDRGCRKGT